MHKPTLERLRELFDCDAERGSLRWKISGQGGRGVQKGREAGSARNKGRYRYVSVDGSYITVANVIWFMHHGAWATSRLSPINGDPADCRITNLMPQRSLQGFDTTTREGRVAYLRAHRKAHPDHYRGKELKKNFGISLEIYQQMFVAQGGVCGICKQPEKDVRNGKVQWLAVDHDHSTDEVRGLLCGSCNKAIGFMCESIENLTNAIAYLKNHQASRLPAADNVVTLRRSATEKHNG